MRLSSLRDCTHRLRIHLLFALLALVLGLTAPAAAAAPKCEAAAYVKSAGEAYDRAAGSRSPSVFANAASRYTDLRALSLFALGRYRKELPPAGSFSGKRSEYLLVNTEKETPPPEALAPLDALHTYYDANRELLAEGYARREAERIAQEQWLKEHPQVPKDTVINFWPKRSRNYPTTGK